MKLKLKEDFEIKAPVTGRFAEILTSEAASFVARLHREFNPQRESLLQRRTERQSQLDRGVVYDFLSETRHVREGDWKVAPVPLDLQDRRVEITGPIERKMMINAFNSGARVFMADFEDANSPTWENVISGHVNLIDAIERRIEHTSPEGKVYRLKEKIATLLVRPRGWHLVEKHFLVEGQPISASLFDFGLYFFHNARRLLEKGSGPYFYLPKLESHLEARLWNDVFNYAQDALEIPRGSIKATVLIETIPAAFEMDEILYELRDHSAGLNAGRWDYIFSIIKKFRMRPDFILPDRMQVTMAVPFMRAYTELLVKTCHRREAHAIGGMAAFIPSRRDPKVNEVALTKVTEDKIREANAGFDGTWVAHPDLVSVAGEVFDEILGDNSHQVARKRTEVTVTPAELQEFRVPDGEITEAGLRNNITVALQYVESWLSGIGAVAIYNLMEDAATAEISRSQIWQWLRSGATVREGQKVSRELVGRIADEELEKISQSIGSEAFERSRYSETREIFEKVALGDEFVEFLTIPAYERL
ncbi:MAG TPA: malate synthase A [Pyrinomonadaceae bacterium]|nr:malate synthase A [Pyrinomonadaceae bacterium]